VRVAVIPPENQPLRRLFAESVLHSVATERSVSSAHSPDELPRCGAEIDQMIDLVQWAAMIETAYLRWQRQQERTYLHPLSGDFLADPVGIVDGRQVTEEELRDALEALDARGLISDEGKLMGRLSRVVLTPDGLRCLVDHDGDVRTWQAAGSPGNVTVHASGPVQAAVSSINVTQIMHAVESGTGPVDYDRYTLAASTLVAGLDNLGLRDDQTA
jgi:hypothetical protein